MNGEPVHFLSITSLSPSCPPRKKCDDPFARQEMAQKTRTYVSLSDLCLLILTFFLFNEANQALELRVLLLEAELRSRDVRIRVSVCEREYG